MDLDQEEDGLPTKCEYAKDPGGAHGADCTSDGWLCGRPLVWRGLGVVWWVRALSGGQVERCAGGP